jgi:hypothetical protein
MTTKQPEPAPAVPVVATSVAPVAPAPAPAPNVSGKPSCGYTILIVIITVIMTLIAEAVVVFALVSYVANNVLKSVKKEMSGTTTSQTSASLQRDSSGKVVLTADQKKILTNFGIKEADIPADFPIEQVVCVQEAVGADRIQAIIDGKATPGLTDLFRARGCLTQ